MTWEQKKLLRWNKTILFGMWEPDFNEKNIVLENYVILVKILFYNF